MKNFFHCVFFNEYVFYAALCSCTYILTNNFLCWIIFQFLGRSVKWMFFWSVDYLSTSKSSYSCMWTLRYLIQFWWQAWTPWCYWETYNTSNTVSSISFSFFGVFRYANFFLMTCRIIKIVYSCYILKSTSLFFFSSNSYLSKIWLNNWKTQKILLILSYQNKSQYNVIRP